MKYARLSTQIKDALCEISDDTYDPDSPDLRKRLQSLISACQFRSEGVWLNAPISLNECCEKALESFQMSELYYCLAILTPFESDRHNSR